MGTVLEVIDGDDYKQMEIIPCANQSNFKSPIESDNIPFDILDCFELYAYRVDMNALNFAGLPVRTHGQDTKTCWIRDVNANNRDDLLRQYLDSSENWNGSSEKEIPVGAFSDGKVFSGSDTISLIPLPTHKLII